MLVLDYSKESSPVHALGTPHVTTNKPGSLTSPNVGL